MSDLFAMKSVRIADKNLFILLHSCAGQRPFVGVESGVGRVTEVGIAGAKWAGPRQTKMWEGSGSGCCPRNCSCLFRFGCRKCNAKCLPPLQLFIVPTVREVEMWHFQGKVCEKKSEASKRRGYWLIVCGDQ